MQSTSELIPGKIYTDNEGWTFRFLKMEGNSIKSDYSIYKRGDTYEFKNGIHGWNISKVVPASSEDEYFLNHTINSGAKTGYITRPKQDSYAIY